MLGYLLRLYLYRGIKLLNKYRTIRFTASLYFKPNINNNTQKRQQCKTDKVKLHIFKLMNNALYGNTIENVTKRSYIRLVAKKTQHALLNKIRTATTLKLVTKICSL